jgi:hypothetical protein
MENKKFYGQRCQDEEYDSMNDYESNITNHYEDDPDDWEGSMIFRHWREDEYSDDYDGSLVFRHWNE